MDSTTSHNKASLWAVGLMLFALFFGAGNLIFPAFLGQQAGENWLSAMFGFLLTGAGLPLLGVIAAIPARAMWRHWLPVLRLGTA